MRLIDEGPNDPQNDDASSRHLLEEKEPKARQSCEEKLPDAPLGSLWEAAWLDWRGVIGTALSRLAACTRSTTAWIFGTRWRISALSRESCARLSAGVGGSRCTMRRRSESLERSSSGSSPWSHRRAQSVARRLVTEEATVVEALSLLTPKPCLFIVEGLVVMVSGSAFMVWRSCWRGRERGRERDRERRGGEGEGEGERGRRRERRGTVLSRKSWTEAWIGGDGFSTSNPLTTACDDPSL
mmetsp:Transcript_26122/g.60281  ORF Transcript_26122/g.60281 Transcript_26122/m.60281 type:complete len:241 (-) Transcript_26122:364-1086(-)